ncbi:MAG: undecaprenyl-diphosphate phosphatase [Candidatus Omnitrophica bacterium]|nr:undecaprenyl-diphosphate phosphatase [Candidatus Omnitrophota bacterium]
MSPIEALVLGVVEGLTEFLPVSSTGHLILISEWMGLYGEGAKTFEVVIQAGALAGILVLYRQRVLAMCRGLAGADPAGRRLLVNLLVSFLPAAVAGVALYGVIKRHLFSTWPVVAALAAGGLFMVALDRWLRRRPRLPGPARTLDSVTAQQAILIGVAQVLSLWPGTSRAMVTLVAGMLVGLPAAAAAEYSFLLAVPTLGAATLFDAGHGGAALLAQSSPAAIAIGFAAAGGVAVLAMRGFIRYLTRRGLAPFGWYRICLALAVWWAASG